LALNEKTVTARSTADLPFGGLGVSLVACEEYAAKLEVRVHTWAPMILCDAMSLYEPPAAPAGFRLLTVLGCEIRGR